MGRTLNQRKLNPRTTIERSINQFSINQGSINQRSSQQIALERAGALRSGFTLVELLIVIVMGIIVAAVAFSLYRVNSDYYLQSDDEIQRQQNARAALNVLTRDLRMAGGGMFLLGTGVKRVQAYVPFQASRQCGEPVLAERLGWFHHCDSRNSLGARAIFGEDGGTERADVVTIFRSEPEFSGLVGEVASFSGGDITLAKSVDHKALSPGDIMALSRGDEAVLFEVDSARVDNGRVDQLAIKTNGRFTGPDGVPPNFPVSGSSLYNLKDVTLVTYFVDETKDQLMAIFHDQKFIKPNQTGVEPVVVADQVEDLQLFYHYDTEKVDPKRVAQRPTLGGSKLDQSFVQAVSLGLTVKSVRKIGRTPQTRPALFNRAAGSAVDNHNRSHFVSTIQLRNYER
ncbi:MAG: hypothetical protein LBT86_04070 [Deltaproteobacteria bacterium]|nr:hypothetical protein [Deltaproteobacteria bacterium]